MNNDDTGATQPPLEADSTHTCVLIDHLTMRTNGAGKAITEKRCVICGQRPLQSPP